MEVNQAANLTAEQIGKIPPQKFGAGLSRQFVMDSRLVALTINLARSLVRLNEQLR